MTAAEYQKIIQGAQSRRKGKVFEDIISASCEYYKMHGIAEIDKTPEPVHQASKMDSRGKFTAFYEKKAQPDFKGTLIGGKSIVLEAKDTDSDRINQSAVTEEQQKALKRHFKLGAECFVIVAFNLQRFYRIPWTLWREMKLEYGRKYIKESEMTAYRLKYSDGVLDFLENVK